MAIHELSTGRWILAVLPLVLTTARSNPFASRGGGNFSTLASQEANEHLKASYVVANMEGAKAKQRPHGYLVPPTRIDFSMADADNGNVLRVTKSSPNVHLDWSLDGTSGPFVLKRSLSFSFSNPVYLGPGQMTKTFDDAVLTNTTSYAYETFRRTLTDTLYFYHADHLGTPIAVTNGAAGLVWRAEHTPFGGIYALTVGTIVNNLRFPGQYYDGETGLAQNYFRDYKHNTGRYWQPDPLGLYLLRTDTEAPVSKYAYVYNSPLSMVDPWGLKGCCRKCPSGKWNYTAGPLSFTFVIGVGGISSRGVLKCKDDPWNNRVPVKVDCRGGGPMVALSWDVLGGSLGDAVSGIKDSCDIPEKATDRIIAGSWPMPPLGWSRSVWGGPFSLTLSPGIGGGFGVFSCTTTRRD